MSRPFVASELAVTTAVGNPAELCAVDLDQIARCAMLVAVRRGPADSQAGVLIQVSQQGHLVAAQDCSDGAARQAS